MRYLITQFDREPFTSELFDPNKDWNSYILACMVVYDLQETLFTIDGQKWLPLRTKKQLSLK